MFQIQVPATSANLAVGYDCLGLAINDLATFTFQKASQPLIIQDCPTKYQNKNNLVYQSFCKGCKVLKVNVPNVKISIQTKIPIARGMGSSATCIVAGLAAAFLWFHEPLNRNLLYQLAVKIEGHPDNVAPAIFGGLCAAYQMKHVYAHLHFSVSPHLFWTVLSPHYPVSTAKARQVLPKTMSYQNVTYQISHCLLLVHALEKGNLSQLKEALLDHMQEPYRQKLIPDYQKVHQIAQNYHSLTYISGSGSTIMIISPSEITQNQCVKELTEAVPNSRIKIVKIDTKGLQFSRK